MVATAARRIRRAARRWEKGWVRAAGMRSALRQNRYLNDTKPRTMVARRPAMTGPEWRSRTVLIEGPKRPSRAAKPKKRAPRVTIERTTNQNRSELAKPDVMVTSL